MTVYWLEMTSLHSMRNALSDELTRFCLADGSYDSEAKARLHRGQRGFFRDGGSHTLSVLANGGYEDDEYPDGAIYHFPKTQVPSNDRSDVVAAENCLRDRVPIFYIKRTSTGPARYQIHYPAWVTAIDRASERLLIEFGRSVQPGIILSAASSFVLRERKRQYQVGTLQREGQARFRMACIQRYGLVGALCGSTEDALLVACHLYPYALGGTDDARNGLILSANHHLLFDKGLIQFSDTYALLVRSDMNQPRFRTFGIVHHSLLHLPNLPAAEAVHAARTKVHKQNEYKDLPSSWIGG